MKKQNGTERNVPEREWPFWLAAVGFDLFRSALIGADGSERQAAGFGILAFHSGAIVENLPCQDRGKQLTGLALPKQTLLHFPGITPNNRGSEKWFSYGVQPAKESHMAPKTKRSNPGMAMPEPGHWTELDLNELLAAHSAAPSFPMDALPDKFRAVADSVATARCLNIDLVACSLIATASGAIGNRVRLEVTAMTAEPLALFMILVAESGEGKTDAIGISQAVFDEIERRGRMSDAPRDPVADAVDKARNRTARCFPSAPMAQI